MYRPFVEEQAAEELLVIMSQYLKTKRLVAANKHMYIISNFNVHFFDFRLHIFRYLSKAGRKKGHDSTVVGTSIAFRNQLLCRYEEVSPTPATQGPTYRDATGLNIPLPNWYKPGVNMQISPVFHCS